MLTVTYAECHIYAPYAECRYAECHYGECCGTDNSLATGSTFEFFGQIIFVVSHEYYTFLIS
jgi:hypothetical protein